MKNYTRSDRVGQLIQVELAKIIQHEMEDSRMHLVTIVGVEVTRDFAYSKIFVSILSDDDKEIADIVSVLNKSSKMLRYRLANEITLRKTPQLTFTYDDTIVKGNKLSSLINRLTRDEKNDE